MLQKFRALNKDVKIALLLLVMGWVYFWVVSYLNLIDFYKQFQEHRMIFICFPRPGKYDIPIYKAICLGLGMLALIFSFRINRNIKLKSTFVALSVLFLLFSYFHFLSIVFDIQSVYWWLFYE